MCDTTIAPMPASFLPSPHTAPSAATVDPEQQAFDALQHRIEVQRASVAAWRIAIDAYEQRYARDVLPLLDRYRDLHVELLNRLDRAASGGLRLGRTDARTLHGHIVEIAGSLLAGEDDAVRRDRLTRLRDRYADTPDTPDVSGAADAIGPAPLPGVAADDPEVVLHRLEVERAAGEADRDRRRAAHRSAQRTAAAARKKPRAPDAVEAARSLRAVYRQLASALHPDRERDESERTRKTTLMQRVNTAYAAGRLTELLQLQREAAASQRQPPGRVAAYNRVLADELAALEREALVLEVDFRTRHHLDPHVRLPHPQTLADRLRVERAGLADGIRALERELRQLDDPVALKQWIQALRRFGRR